MPSVAAAVPSPVRLGARVVRGETSQQNYGVEPTQSRSLIGGTARLAAEADSEVCRLVFGRPVDVAFGAWGYQHSAVWGG